MANNKEKLLREFVHEILKEDFGGADFGGGDFGMGGGMGGNIGDDDLFNVFIKPFTDVYNTAVGKTKEMSVATAKLLRVSLEAILTSVIPVLSSDYDKIFKKYDTRMDKVRAEYKDIYDSTWTAFTDNDVVLAAFGMYPALMITQVMARKAPIPVLHTLDALTGGFFEDYFDRIEKILNPNDVKPIKHDPKGGNIGFGAGMGGYDGGGFGGGMGESVLHEKKSSSKEKQKKKINDPADLLLKPKIMAAIDKNPRVQGMMKSMRASFHETLEELFDRIQKVLNAKSVQQIQQITGSQIKGLDNLQKMEPQAAQQANDQIMKSVHAAIKNVYVKNLTLQIKEAQKAGVPQGHPMLTDLASAVKRIKSF